MRKGGGGGGGGGSYGWQLSTLSEIWNLKSVRDCVLVLVVSVPRAASTLVVH